MYIVDAVPWQVKLGCKADFMESELLHFVGLTAENREGRGSDVGWSAATW